MCPFPLGCPPCWYIVVHSILLRFLKYFCGISCYPLMSNFVYLSSLSLFFLSLARGLLHLFIFLKKPVVAFIDLFYCFWTLFISSLVFIISFFLLTLDFVLFLILLGGKLGCLRLFSCFLRKACISMNFPLGTAFLCSMDYGSLCFHFRAFCSLPFVSFLCPLCAWHLPHCRKLPELLTSVCFCFLNRRKCQWSKHKMKK